jgi:hypothetical protein
MLVRYSNREHPNDVFSNGFGPRYDPNPDPNSHPDPRCEERERGGRGIWRGEETIKSIVIKLLRDLDFLEYVINNVSAVFVSTTVVRLNNAGNRYWWRPYNLNRIFEYVIFAPGGIDVNTTLGPHQYWNQYEIPFPGGINRVFIRYARERDENGRVIQLWVNNHFNSGGSIVASALLGFRRGSAQTIIWREDWDTGNYGHNPNELRRRAEMGDAMREPGDQMPYDEETEPAQTACWLLPGSKKEAYFFADINNINNIKIKVTPGKVSDSTLSDRTCTALNWQSLRKVCFYEKMPS